MVFIEKLKAGVSTLSYEFYPPKDADGWGTLYATLGEICRHRPDYVTVTYGAGGSERQKTVDLVGRIQRELDIEAMAHLTCVGHSQAELYEVLTLLQNSSVRSIMALRGDPPKGDIKFTPHPDGFSYASELIAFIRRNFDFQIGCSYYPEKHPEAESLAKDIGYLKLKQENGADFAVSQFFFDNDDYYRYRDLAVQEGVTLPLVAGLLPITALKQLSENGIIQRSGSRVPEKLRAAIGDGATKEIIKRGIDYGIAQCQDLLDNGAAGIHLYTLNRSSSSVKITEGLRALGYLAS